MFSAGPFGQPSLHSLFELSLGRQRTLRRNGLNQLLKSPVPECLLSRTGSIRLITARGDPGEPLGSPGGTETGRRESNEAA